MIPTSLMDATIVAYLTDRFIAAAELAGIQDLVFGRVHTFGKALGCHGAAVVGGELLKQYLVNFARSFIYTTAAPFHQLASVKMAYELLGSADDEIEKLKPQQGP